MNYEEIEIRIFFYSTLDFSMFSHLDTVELADSFFNYNEFLKESNNRIKTLKISGEFR